MHFYVKDYSSITGHGILFLAHFYYRDRNTNIFLHRITVIYLTYYAI